MDGILRKYNAKRGFGFVEPLRGRPGEEWIFCHASAFVDGHAGIPAGSRVRFQLVEGWDGRPQCARVVLVRAKETTPTPAANPQKRQSEAVARP